MIGCEAAGEKRIDTDQACSNNGKGNAGVFHGMKIPISVRIEYGQIAPVYSISAGLDYPGIGPGTHGCARYRTRKHVPVTDEEAGKAFYEYLARTGHHLRDRAPMRFAHARNTPTLSSDPIDHHLSIRARRQGRCSDCKIPQRRYFRVNPKTEDKKKTLAGAKNLQEGCRKTEEKMTQNPKAFNKRHCAFLTAGDSQVILEMERGRRI